MFMENNSFNDWEQKITQEAAKLDIQLEFKDKIAGITQEDPWHIKTILN